MSAAAAPGEFSRTTFKTLLVRLVTQALTIGAGIIIARSLGPAGKGIFTYASTVLMLLVTLGGGASAAVSRQYGRLQVDRGVVYAGMMRFFYAVCLPVSIALTAAALLLHQPVLIAPAVAFPFAYLNQVSVGFSLADGQVGFANAQGLLNALFLTVTAAILCFALHLRVEAMLAGWIAVNAAITVYSIFNMRKYKGPPGTPQERAEAFREHTSFGLRVTVNQLLGLLNYQIDIFIVLFVLGHASLGRYSIAVGVGMMMWQLSRPLSVASYGSVTRGSAQTAARITVLCVRHALFNVGVACAVLVFMGPWLLRTVYGPAFDQSGRALQLLLPGIIAYCTVPFFSQYFTLQMGKPGINTLVTATSTAVCAVVTLALIHRFGIAAGAIGTSVSYTAGFIICASVFCKSTGTAPSSLFAFGMHDLQQYGTLLGWIFSGMRSTYVRRGG